MKGVEEISTRQAFRIPLQGAPAPSGWAVKYLSGMEEKSDIKPGYWLQWFEDPRGPILRFTPELLMTFGDGEEAKRVSATLHASDIKTEIVKV